MERDGEFTHFVAIDFGISGCGMAFSTNEGPENIRVFANWNQSKMSVKCPPALLLNDLGEFEAFGDTAIRNYESRNRLMRPQKADQYYFFYRYKMCLYQKNLTRNLNIAAQNGRELPAIKVIAITLGHLKDLMLQEINQHFQHPNIKIQWILTVPAIWSEAAKQLMREAASQAGLGEGKGNVLKLVLEPEAAAMFCFKEICKINISQPNKDEVNYYLLADCGDSTVDIVAHKLTKKANGQVFIEEIHKVCGGCYGSFAVNNEFEKMLQKMFQLTTEELEFIKRKFAQKWTKLAATDFENAKYAVDPNNAHTVCTIALSSDLCSGINNLKHKTVAQLVKEYTQHTLEWDEEHYELIIPYCTMKSLFLPIIAKIVTVIEEVLQKPECKPIKQILLVGIFSGNHLLFDEFVKRFAPLKIMIKKSEEPWLSVVKGAILYTQQNIICSRKMTQSLGIETWDKFRPGVHQESKKIVINGRELCKHRFTKFVEVNESVNVSDVIDRTYYPVSNEVNETTIRIYGSQSNVEYTDDYGCYQVGVIKVDLPELETGMSREIRVVMQVSGTEIKVSAYTCTEKSQPLPLHLDLIVDKYAVTH